MIKDGCNLDAGAGLGFDVGFILYWFDFLSLFWKIFLKVLLNSEMSETPWYVVLIPLFLLRMRFCISTQFTHELCCFI